MSDRVNYDRIPEADLLAAFPGMVSDICGEPNVRLSRPGDVRYGSKGSLSIDPAKGTFFDHEAGQGGGIIEFIARYRQCDVAGALEYAREWTGRDNARAEADWRAVQRYTYCDAGGQERYRVVRMEDFASTARKRPKRIFQEHPTADGRWQKGLNGAPPLLFHLPELLASAVDGDTVFIVEGEPKVEKLRDWGLRATCNSGGAGKWDRSFAEHFRGRDVVVLPDNDPAGRKHADIVKRSLQGVAAKIRIVELPDLADKEDVVDWAAKGGDRDRLIALIAQATDYPDAGDDLLDLIDPTVWEGLPVPPRLWHVPGLIPHRTVTKISGNGGDGKSLLTLQLLVSTVLGKPWIGLEVPQGRALYLSAEDDAEEVQRRLADIMREYRVSFGDLRDLRISVLAGLDAVLAGATGRAGNLETTELWAKLVRTVAAFRPRILAIDTLADVFSGDEIRRELARQFIGLLRGLAIRFDMTVLLLAHPSLGGIASGKGSSGSTGWDNSVRSALYLRPAKDEGGNIVDPDLRIIETVKANYSKTGQSIVMRWRQGVFIPDDQATPNWLDKKAAIAKADEVFLALLKIYTSEGRNVSANPSSTYAPALFAKDNRSKGTPRRALVDAMNRLLEDGTINIVGTGPSYKRRQVIVVSDRPRED